MDQNENPLARYIGRDILETVSSLTVCKGHSSKKDVDYNYLNLTFDNGYSVRIFLSNDAQYIVSQLLN